MVKVEWEVAMADKTALWATVASQGWEAWATTMPLTRPPLWMIVPASTGTSTLSRDPCSTVDCHRFQDADLSFAPLES